jgi:hypothetical protein
VAEIDFWALFILLFITPKPYKSNKLTTTDLVGGLLSAA